MTASTPTVIVTTTDELRRIVRTAVDEALATRASGAGTSEWLDATAVGALFGIHPRSVRKLPGLPAHVFGPKLLRYRRDEVLAWADKQGRKVAR